MHWVTKLWVVGVRRDEPYKKGASLDGQLSRMVARGMQVHPAGHALYR
jgi:hypothetical protein